MSLSKRNKNPIKAKGSSTVLVGRGCVTKGLLGVLVNRKTKKRFGKRAAINGATAPH